MNTSKWFKVFGVLVLCLGSANVVYASAWSGAGEPKIVRGSGSEMVSSVGAKATVVPASCSGTAPTSNARIRGGPGTEYSVVSSAKKCERISVTGRNSANNWLQLSTGGWISRALVVNAPASLPVVNAPAAPTVVALKAAPIVVAPTAVPVMPTAAPVVAPTAVPPTAVPPTAVPQAAPTAVPAPVAQCDPNYGGVCVPLVSYDLDCKDIPARKFQSIGNDPHGLDRDKDGIACES